MPGDERAGEARSWRDTNRSRQTSLDEKKSDTRMQSAIARAMKGERFKISMTLRTRMNARRQAMHAALVPPIAT